MLLPGEIRKYIQVPFKWGQYFYILPFVWDEEEQCVKVTTSKKQILGVYTWCAVATTVQILMTLRFFLDLKWVEKGANMHILMMLFNFGSFIQNEICLLMVYKQVPMVVNTFISYYDYFEETYSKRKSIYSDFNKRLQRLLPPSVFYGFHIWSLIIFGYVMFSPLHLKFVRRTFLLEWMFGESCSVWGIPVDGALLSLCLGIAGDIFASTSVYFWTLIAVLGSYLQVIVRDMAPEGNKRKYWTRESLRRPGCFCMVSKQIQFLFETWTLITEPISLVMPANFVMVMTLFAFHVLKATDSTARIGSIASLVLILVVFAVINSFGGRTSDCFKCNLEEFLRRQHSLYVIKVVRGIRVPYYKPYGMFIVANQLTISGMQTVFDNVISLIAI